ncbi:MAG: carboxymuconolactone decarboxylase family protein [Alphaproteobacteria bacterium]|nr:carboxymuconolactone decarboxylase family protein [Alphaproteobacteria bacterium]
MAKSDLHDKGMAIRTELLGKDYVERMNQDTYQDPVMQKFRDVAAENVFGALWTRPGLDLKTRTMICVISDAATGRDPELALHLRMARRQGWTEEELTEALIHLSGYIGVPLIREAMLTASKVFKEMREEGMD